FLLIHYSFHFFLLLFSSSLIFTLLFFFFFHCYVHLRDLHSFPTRRSSDLKVFKASRLNLGGRLSPPFFLCKMFLKSCLWKGVHDCAKVWRASKALPDGGLRL